MLKIMNYKRNKKRIKMFLIISVCFLILLTNKVYAMKNPIFVIKVKRAFERIQDYLIFISTPAAGVAICTGFLMKKFSFGDEERIRTAKKVIRGSVVSYVFILSIKFIIDLIQVVLK